MPFSSLSNTDRFSYLISSLGKADIVIKQDKEVETEKCVQNRALELPPLGLQSRDTWGSRWRPETESKNNSIRTGKPEAAQANLRQGLHRLVTCRVYTGRRGLTYRATWPRPASWRTGGLVETG